MQNLHNSELVDEMEKARQELQKWMQERVRNVEDIKKKHQSATAKYTGEVASIQQQMKTGEATAQSVRKELAEEEREMKRLQHMIKKMRDKENLMPQELEQRKRKVDKQHEKLEALKRLLVDRQREYAQSLQAPTQDVNRYRERLGLDLQRVGINHMRFTFVHIDPNHPMREFSFDLHLDTSDRYHVEDCKPMVDGLAAMVETLNANGGDLTKFVVAIRGKFKETLLRGK